MSEHGRARRTTSRAEKLDSSLPLPALSPVRKHHREYITMTKLTGKVRIRARRRAARDEPRRLAGNDNGGSHPIGARLTFAILPSPATRSRRR